MPRPTGKKAVRKRTTTRPKSVSQHMPPDDPRGAAIDELLDAASVLSDTNEDASDDNPESSVDEETPDEDEDQPAITGRRAGAVIRKTNKNRKYDWDTIRSAYVEGIEQDDGGVVFPTLGQVARQYNVHESRVREHSADERWSEQRSVFQRRYEVKKQSERQKKMVNEAVAFDGQNLGLAKLGLQLIMSRMADIGQDMVGYNAQKQRTQQDRDAGLPTERLLSPVYHMEMANLARAAETFQNVGIRALGEDIAKVEFHGVVESTVDVNEQMRRDDTDRLAQLMAAAAQSGLFRGIGVTGAEDIFYPGEEDAVVVEDERDGNPAELEGEVVDAESTPTD